MLKLLDYIYISFIIVRLKIIIIIQVNKINTFKLLKYLWVGVK